MNTINTARNRLVACGIAFITKERKRFLKSENKF